MNISYRGFVRVSKKSVALALGLVMLVGGFTFSPASKTQAVVTGTLYTSSQGFYNEWENGEGEIDETSSFKCNDGDYIRDVGGSNSNNDRETFNVDLSGIPNGSVITDVEVITYSRDDENSSQHNPQTGQFRHLVRLDGTNFLSTGNPISPADDDGCYYETRTIDVTNTVKNGSTDLEIGVEKTNASTKVRVGAIHAKVTYTAPDTTAPTVTINQAPTQIDPTSSSPIRFFVDFNEDVTDFDDTGDILLSGTAGATTVVINNAGDADASTYEVAVSGMTNSDNDTVVASVVAGAAKDASNNLSAASSSTDNTVTYHINVAPTATGENVVTSEETPVGITLDASDANSGDTLTYIIVTEPIHGDLTGTGASRTYTPDNNFHDTDSFTFKVNDGSEDSNIATVNITVTDVCEQGEHLNNENQCVPNDVPPPTCDEGEYWNGQQCVPEVGQCNVEATFTVLSDANEEVDGGPALSVQTWEHPAWLDEAPGNDAKWIWNTEEVTNPLVDETHTFTDTFTIVGTATGGTLSIAADNGYDVELNGNPVCSAPAESANYAAYQNCVVAPELFVNGENTLSVEVKNLGYATEDPHVNPAGVIYKLVVNENECDTPVDNTCIFPDTEDASDTVVLGTSAETTLQTILNNAGYSLDADDDQQNFQEWTDAGQTVNFTAKFLDKFAGNSHVFGYYVNGGAFVPVFRNGAVDPVYMSAPLKAPGDSVSFSVPNVSDIVFAIADWNASTNTFYSTEQTANADGAVHALVYNPDDNEYVLAFEDLVIPSPSDEDYNDFVVALTVDSCEKGATCEPGEELLLNGDFEDGNVGSSWNIFASGTIDWMAQWLNPTGAPEIANLELQGQGLNGWNASTLNDATGTQWTELDSDWGGPSSGQSGEAGSVKISQTIDTVIGETYTVSFDFSPRPGTSALQNKVEVLANGTSLGFVGGVTDASSFTNTAWSSHTFSFEADSYTTTISFRDAGTPNDSLGTFIDNASVMCEAPEPTATLVATKIVCDDESYLPNWGAGGADITASTAQDFLNAVNDGHDVPVCRLVPDWQFQWVANEDSSTNPGDNIVSPAPSPWYSFGPTAGNGTISTEIPAGGMVWVREILKTNYIPFTGQNTTENVSAEIYCSTDVLNYDNWDYINPVEADETYYCVAFNAPIEEIPQCDVDAQHVLLSSDDNGEVLLTQDEAGPASLVAAPHEGWFDPIDALWIWKDVSTSVEDADVGTSETFTRTFEIVGTPLDSTLTLAVDNSYEVKVNGNTVCADADEFNYAATVDCAVPASVLLNGTNTITFEVVNMNHETANDPSNNPAGLLYKLVVNENECVVPEEPTSTVTMCKDDENGVALSGWTLMLQGEHVDGFAVAVNNSAGTNTTQVLDDALSYVAVATGTWLNSGQAGNYVDAEYSTSDAWTTPIDGFLGYSTDILELQINSRFDSDGNNWGPYNSTHVYAQSFTPSVDGPANFRIYDGHPVPTVQAGWYGDNVENTLGVNVYEGYAGVTGKDGCVTFTDVPYGAYTATEVSKEGWSYMATWDGETATTEPKPIVAVNAPTEIFTIQNNDTRNDDDGDYEDYGSGTLVIKKVTQFADEGNFDFDIGGNESFYDADVVVNNGEGETSLELPTGTYSLTETQQEDWEFGSVTCSYEGESAGSSIPFGHQISIYNGETVTCTFLNNYDDDSGGSGNSVNGGPSDDGDGEVLGAVASESQSCGPLLTTFMRMGIDNNGDEVIKLQDFLNGEMGSALPVTGVFGPLTDAAVRAFQLKYWEDVLQPWFGLEGSAIQDQDDTTGYVYKTTKWKINNIFCPDSEAMPALP